MPKEIEHKKVTTISSSTSSSPRIARESKRGKWLTKWNMFLKKRHPKLTDRDVTTINTAIASIAGSLVSIVTVILALCGSLGVL